MLNKENVYLIQNQNEMFAKEQKKIIAEFH